MISIKVKEARFQVFFWLYISVMAEKMNRNILVSVITIETDDGDNDADIKSTVKILLLFLNTTKKSTR